MAKRAHLLYQTILNELLASSLVSNTVTDAQQLDDLGSALFGNEWSGVFSSDQFNTIKAASSPGLYKGAKPPGQQSCLYAIINTKPKGHPGEHWCAVFNNKKTPVVYDSFGRKIWKDSIPTDSDVEQHDLEHNCGARCLSWLLLVKHFGIDTALKV